jgi:hypothetical protein
MVKAIANEKGFFGGVVRDPGDSFIVPDAIWNDPKKRPSWARKDDRPDDLATEPKGESVGEGEGEATPIPADWRSLSAKERKALAEAISGEKPANAKEADALIEACAKDGAEPFADAPEPEAAGEGNGLQDALGGIPPKENLGDAKPDWEAPAAPKPVED